MWEFVTQNHSTEFRMHDRRNRELAQLLNHIVGNGQ